MGSLWRRVVVTCFAALLMAVNTGPAQAQTVDQGPGLPQDGDLSLAATAGTTLIGLTLRPPAPGPNTVFLYLLPVGGPAAAANMDVTLRVDDTSVPLTFCSRNCRTADVNLVGGEHLVVSVQEALSSTSADFSIPQLPLADGSQLFNLLQQRMHQLHSYSIDETLGPTNPAIQTHYTEVSPGQTSIVASNGFQMTWIGTTQYSRPSPTDAWTSTDMGLTLPVPSFMWDSQRGSTIVSPQIVGSDTIDGQAVQVLGFFMKLGQLPFWFRLWVDDSGVVLTGQMRGQGHFMDQHFGDIDAALTVAPPT
jgi:hypothetical protein